MMRGGFMNHKVSSLEEPSETMFSFIQYLLSIYYMLDTILDNGDHSESSPEEDMHPSSVKPYLVNCYPASI